MSTGPEPHYFFVPHHLDPPGLQSSPTPSRPSQSGELTSTVANSSAVAPKMRTPASLASPPTGAAPGSLCTLTALGNGFSGSGSGGASMVRQNATTDCPSFSSYSSEMPSMSFLPHAFPLHQPTAGDIFGLSSTVTGVPPAAPTTGGAATSVAASSLRLLSDSSLSFPTALVLQQQTGSSNGASGGGTAPAPLSLSHMSRMGECQIFVGSSRVDPLQQPQYYFIPAGGSLALSHPGLAPQHSSPQQLAPGGGVAAGLPSFLAAAAGAPSPSAQLFSPVTGGALSMQPTASIFDTSLNSGSVSTTGGTLGVPCVTVGQTPTPASTAAATPPTANSTSSPEEAFNVLSEDKRVMLTIPVGLIEPTTGSSKYLQQGASACYTFRFQLCRSYRPHGRCAHRHQCAFIHSRHVVDASLASCVAETLVHRNAPIAAGDTPPYPTHPPGVALQVYDSMEHKNLTVDSSLLYVTSGSQAALRAADKDASGQGINSLASVRLQLCLHFDKGLCARGSTCNFVHKVTVASDRAGVAQPPSLEASSGLVTKESDPSVVSTASSIEQSASRGLGGATGSAVFLQPPLPPPPLPLQQQQQAPQQPIFIPVSTQTSGSSMSGSTTSSLHDPCHFAPMSGHVLSTGGGPAQLYYFAAPSLGTTGGGGSAAGSPAGTAGGQWATVHHSSSSSVVHPGLFPRGELQQRMEGNNSGVAANTASTMLPVMYPAWGTTMDASFGGLTLAGDPRNVVVGTNSANVPSLPTALPSTTQTTATYTPVQRLYY